MRIRSKAREVALCILYQHEVSKLGSAELFESYLEYYPQREEVIDFSRSLAEGVLARIDSLDAKIKTYAKNWEIERMAIIDRNVLRMAIYELLWIDDVPPKVSINEAIELAKKFGDTDSPRFVNGILDKIYKMETAKADKEKADHGES